MTVLFRAGTRRRAAQESRIRNLDTLPNSVNSRIACRHFSASWRRHVSRRYIRTHTKSAPHPNARPRSGRARSRPSRTASWMIVFAFGMSSPCVVDSPGTRQYCPRRNIFQFTVGVHLPSANATFCLRHGTAAMVGRRLQKT